MTFSEVPEDAPNQYGEADVCNPCGRPLSRYNPYVTCGPCRVRIAQDIVDDFDEDDALERYPVVSYIWERFAKRQPIKRGPLMLET